MSARALVALGGNLGDVAAILAAARRALADLPESRLLAASALYRSKAVGPGAQPDYLNGVVVLETALAAADLLQRLHAIEAGFGRVRQQRWGARTLDLDLLACGALCCNDATLQLPHPRLAARPFVLLPLYDVAADWCHPRSGLTVREMVAELRQPDAAWKVVAPDGW